MQIGSFLFNDIRSKKLKFRTRNAEGTVVVEEKTIAEATFDECQRLLTKQRMVGQVRFRLVAL